MFSFGATRPIRRKVFISYHHADQEEVNRFINTFDHWHDVFIFRALGYFPGDIIDSTNTEYVMRRIREDYLRDSTVTIVLVGRCTWARRYVDWEIQASLRHGKIVTPNGLLGIILPSAGANPTAPERLRMNLGLDSSPGYARWYWYPQSVNTLAIWIEDAFQRRASGASLIINPRERFGYNRQCQ